MKPYYRRIARQIAAALQSEYDEAIDHHEIDPTEWYMNIMAALDDLVQAELAAGHECQYGPESAKHHSQNK